jgi:hypothetical protein
MTPVQKQWIDDATYEQLLERWRFGADISWFQDECGEHYLTVMSRKRDEDPAGAVRACSRIGWERR